MKKFMMSKCTKEMQNLYLWFHIVTDE